MLSPVPCLWSPLWGLVLIALISFSRKENVSSKAIKPTWAPFVSTVSAEERLAFSLRLMNGRWEVILPSCLVWHDALLCSFERTFCIAGALGSITKQGSDTCWPAGNCRVCRKKTWLPRGPAVHPSPLLQLGALWVHPYKFASHLWLLCAQFPSKHICVSKCWLFSKPVLNLKNNSGAGGLKQTAHISACRIHGDLALQMTGVLRDPSLDSS